MAFDDRIFRDDTTGVVVDLSHAPKSSGVDLPSALDAMAALESGALANPTEGRQVGHYWLRDPDRAPTPELANSIRETWNRIASLDTSSMTDILLLGIGGSSLGPQLAISALQSPNHAMRFHVIDTADPVAIEKHLQSVDPRTTLVLVVSKSGKTTETCMALQATEAHWAQAGEAFADHAICVTRPDSPLVETAMGWRAIFPIPEWVGGRTSITSAVGLLPMALSGIDIDSFLAGARAMDAWTRTPAATNPAAQLAAAWYAAHPRNLVMLPYVDSLSHLGRYLQQLVMESLGKTHTRSGEEVHHGLTVYGNKGSADQHAIVQQLRDGPDDILVHFVDRAHAPTTSLVMQDAADTQFCLLAGTEATLREVGRPLISITIPDESPLSLGALIALFERTVGLYAEIADLNAYDQPGVEAGKQACREHIQSLERIRTTIDDTPRSAEELANHLSMQPEAVWRLCQHLASTGRCQRTPGKRPMDDRFQAVENFAK